MADRWRPARLDDSLGVTEALRGEGAVGLVGKGTVDGTLEGNSIRAKFHDAADNSHAEIKLTRK